MTCLPSTFQFKMPKTGSLPMKSRTHGRKRKKMETVAPTTHSMESLSASFQSVSLNDVPPEASAYLILTN